MFKVSGSVSPTRSALEILLMRGLRRRRIFCFCHMPGTHEKGYWTM